MAADNTSDLNALDKICDDYEQSLPDHTDFPQTLQRLNSALERAPQSLQHTLLQLLLELEFEHRLMNNQPCPHSELLQHFPNFSPSIENALAAARQRTGLAGTLQMPTAAADSQSSPTPPTPPAPQNLPLTPAPSAPPHAQPHPSHPHSHASLWCVISGDGVVSATDNSWDEEIGRDFIVGTLLQQRFLVTDVLGRGGMGCVLLARDQILHRDVAVKVLLRKPSHSSSQLHESLSREAQLAASLNHRGIAVVHDFGSHAGRSFTVFEYVRGRTLRALLDECRTFTPEQTRSIILELADALDAAHAAGVIHQDLKPENICITLDGQPKILDFGVARHLSGNVASRGFFGTPLYASPEQAACSATDGRTDQYALALLAFEMLSGQRVFPSGSPLELLRQHREITPPRLDSVCSHLHVQIANSIHRALAKRPTDRFATCREFAEAAFPQPATTATPANIPTVPEAERLDVFLCQVAPNSLFARRLAEFLQRYGLKTWYYQHDASPGVSFLKQTTDAIQRSRTVLLIISPAALISEDFALQLQAATERRRTLLPLLLDISPEDFERRQPAWRALLGPAALLDLNGIDQKNAFPKVLQRLQLAGLAADHHRHTTRIPSPNHNSARPSHHSATQGQVWATDSSQIDADDLPQLVFQNELVEEFLSRRNRYFLSGTKGLGKTLLLSYKRQLIANRAAEGDRGAASTCLIPHSGSRLDLMHEMRTVSEHFESSLAELSVTKRFWSTALRISAISHYDGHIAPDEKSELLAFPERFRRWLLGAKVAPSVVFKELTNLSVGQAKSLVDNTETFLDEKLRSIHNPTCFFVDKVDQAIRERSREAWIHIQAGLIEAAWEIMNSNSHVRIYASIRQEAFSNYHSDVKSNLLGATVRLRYTDAELEHMLDRLANCYESQRDFRDFLGLRVLQHPGRPAPEDTFRFLRRHTFGRPRDLVVIAAELSSQRNLLSEARYCDIVRNVSARSLVTNVFEEMRVFLDCLGDPDNRDRFLRLLSANILSRADAVKICAQFNEVPEHVVRDFGEDSDDIFHPFQDLYLAGLLGIVTEQPDTALVIQRFRRPDDLVSTTGTDLPQSHWYFIHPALSAYIRQQAWGSSFLHLEQAAVGDGLPWHPWDPVCCEVERCARQTHSPDIKLFALQVLREAREVLASGSTRNLQVLLQALPGWQTNLQKLHECGHLDLILWLEELAACKR